MEIKYLCVVLDRIKASVVQNRAGELCGVESPMLLKMLQIYYVWMNDMFPLNAMFLPNLQIYYVFVDCVV